MSDPADNRPEPTPPPDCNHTLTNRGVRDALSLHMVRGIGAVHYAALVERFGDATAVLDAPVQALLSAPGVGRGLAERIRQARHNPQVDVEMTNIKRLAIRLLMPGDESYPALLREIHDHPAILFTRGELLPRDQLAVAIVGSRRCTAYGARQAERLAAGLAQIGFTIVSGLARGIDAAAHRGAIQATGRTIAVLASGLERIYPPDHEALADQIQHQGALISELPTCCAPIGSLFPRRNRIISGMCSGVIVVEAAPRSGALVTAAHAVGQNREVMAVPGPVDSLASRGCHRLIRDGARLIESVEDVVETLGPLAQPVQVARTRAVRHPIELTLNEQERAVVNLLGSDPVSSDEIVVRCGLATSQVLATLSVLELRRLIRRLPGSLYVRV